MSWSTAYTSPRSNPGWGEKKSSTRRSYTSKWHMGNSRKRQQLMKHFGQMSTMHGMTHVCLPEGNSSLCITIVYRVFFTVCFLLVVYSVVSLFQENFRKQSTFINTINRDVETGIEEDPDHFPLFPRITVCRMPSYKTDFNMSYLQLVEYIMLSLGTPFRPLTPTEVNMIVLLALYDLQMVNNLTEPAIVVQRQLAALEKRFEALKATDHFHMRKFIIEHSLNCSEFFVSCHLLNLALDCCLLFEPVLTSIGLCFSLRDIKSITSVISSVRPNSIVTLLLDLSTPPTLTQRSEVGFRVFLSNPFEEAPVYFEHFDGEDVVPGITTTINTQLIKTQRTALHTPWHGMWNTCPKRWFNETYQTNWYSKYRCTLDFDKRLLLEICKCKALIHTGGPSDVRLCEPIDFYQCLIQAGIKFDLKEWMTLCEEACTVYSYKAEPSFSGLGGDSTVSRVGIMHNCKQYIYNEYRKTTISSILSQIGGSLGLYLGASIITVMEIITFIASWMWYRLAPAKSAPMSAKQQHLSHKNRQPTSNLRRRRQISDRSQQSRPSPIELQIF